MKKLHKEKAKRNIVQCFDNNVEFVHFCIVFYSTSTFDYGSYFCLQLVCDVRRIMLRKRQLLIVFFLCLCCHREIR